MQNRTWHCLYGHWPCLLISNVSLREIEAIEQKPNQSRDGQTYDMPTWVKLNALTPGDGDNYGISVFSTILEFKYV